MPRRRGGSRPAWCRRRRVGWTGATRKERRDRPCAITGGAVRGDRVRLAWGLAGEHGAAAGWLNHIVPADSRYTLPRSYWDTRTPHQHRHTPHGVVVARRLVQPRPKSTPPSWPVRSYAATNMRFTAASAARARGLKAAPQPMAPRPPPTSTSPMSSHVTRAGRAAGARDLPVP